MMPVLRSTTADYTTHVTKHILQKGISKCSSQTSCTQHPLYKSFQKEKNSVEIQYNNTFMCVKFKNSTLERSFSATSFYRAGHRFRQNK